MDYQTGEDKKKHTLDQYQQKAVGARINTVVAAGAGSGKTTVLSQRFLELVRDHEAEVGSILTLTFTRKAAIEKMAASITKPYLHQRW